MSPAAQRASAWGARGHFRRDSVPEPAHSSSGRVWETSNVSFRLLLAPTWVFRDVVFQDVGFQNTMFNTPHPYQLWV